MPSYYIHMTTSATLALLPHTNFDLCDINSLLLDYNLAPIAGEITGGGLKGVIEEGPIAFAELESSYWDTQLLYNKYGKIRYTKNYQSFEDLANKIDQLCKNNLNVIAEVIIQIMRDKQMANFLKLTPEQKFELINKVEITAKKIKKKFITNYIAARFLRPDETLVWPETDTVYDFIENISEKLPENYLDLPVAEQIKILNQFEPPNKLFIADTFQTISQGKEVALQRSLIRSLKYDNDEFISGWLFSKEINRNKPDIKLIQETIQKAIHELTSKVTLFKKIMEEDNFGKRFNEEPFVNNPFAIAFVIRGSNLLTPVKHEYRAKRNLCLGTDIKIIATDDSHISLVKDFLNQHRLDHISVKSITQLSQEENQKMACTLI